MIPTMRTPTSHGGLRVHQPPPCRSRRGKAMVRMSINSLSVGSPQNTVVRITQEPDRGPGPLGPLGPKSTGLENRWNR